jgi:hypothetical protein
MKRSGKADMDMEIEDDMLPEYDLSKAVPGYTAFRIGEDSDDEDSVEKFWLGLGFEVERITEPAMRFSKAPDFLLRRQGTAVAVCEVKSMSEFDYTVQVNHKDGTATDTQHNWRESNLERVLQRAERAVGQLTYWNEDRALVNVFVFVNHNPNMRYEEIAGALRDLNGIDATFWFDVGENGALSSNPSVIASREGRQRLKKQIGLTLDASRVLTSAA